MGKDYSPPPGWTPQRLEEDNDFLCFGRYLDKKVKDVPADYLLFMEDRGWIELSDTLRKACELETETRNKE